MYEPFPSDAREYLPAVLADVPEDDIPEQIRDAAIERRDRALVRLETQATMARPT